MTNTLADIPLSHDMARKLARASSHASKWSEKREELIVEAYREGAGVRQIGRVVGMSHVGVIGVLRRHGIDGPVEPTS